MPRFWIWLQLVLGWLPVWALYSTLIVVAHPPTQPMQAALIGVRAIVPAALLGLLVHRFTQRLPWPSPFRISFMLVHAASAALYSATWLLLNAAWALAGHGESLAELERVAVPFLVLGFWLYIMVAGVSYARQASERAVSAEASAARAQLAALRAQLHPHFLFNALHTVVQLIPREPARAAEAAELVASMLRTTLDDERDLVTVADELAFVRRYVEIETLRFGDRLHVQVSCSPTAARALVPSFAVQTLIENAVQHGAAPKVAPTNVHIEASMRGDTLCLIVVDDGDGARAHPESGVTPLDHTSRGDGRSGGGLLRLGERLRVLYGADASLRCAPIASGGFEARIEIRHVRSTKEAA
ncbi:MAG TPA: histidine kinase [Gemmatimonas sp.]|nr:histidine kinase [Gemmatimonas sp.]